MNADDPVSDHDRASGGGSTGSRLVSFGQLARMLGPGWSRPVVWYWAERAGIEVVTMPGMPYRFVRSEAIAEVLAQLRAARVQRRHDGHGQHGRPWRYRRSEEKGRGYER